MKIELHLFVPVLIKLGSFLQEAIAFCATEHSIKGALQVDPVANFLERKMQDWDPVVSRIHVLDPDTKKAAARLVAGIAINAFYKRGV